MKVLSGGLKSIEKCAALLRSGQLLAIPTETVYGLAAVASDEQAIAKIFAAKNRPTFDPLIVHVPSGWASLRKLDECGITNSSLMNENARKAAESLMQAFWPGPLTLVLPRGVRIPDLVTSGLDTVGVRMPRHALAQDLLRALQLPLAAPSANQFGRISPTTSSAVSRELDGRVDYVLEGGPCEVGLESTIVHVAPDARLTLLRPGAVSRTEISEVTGLEVGLPDPTEKSRSSAEIAPGMLASHYAPRKPLFLGSLENLHEQLLTAKSEKRAGKMGVLLVDPASLAALAAEFGPPSQDAPYRTELLAADADWSEMARRLFAVLRELDESPEVDRLFAEDPASSTLTGKDQGIALAIRDRLVRASAPRD